MTAENRISSGSDEGMVWITFYHAMKMDCRRRMLGIYPLPVTHWKHRCSDRNDVVPYT